MKKTMLLCMAILIILTLISCAKKDYPYTLSKSQADKFVDAFSSLTESDDEFTLKPSDFELYQINKDEQAGVIKSDEESKEFIVIMDKDYNLISNIFVSSEEEKMLILSNDEIPNIAVEKSGFYYNGNTESKFKEAIKKAATGTMLEALNNAKSMETKKVNSEIFMGGGNNSPYVKAAIYYYEISVTDEQGNILTGLFHAKCKNYLNKTPEVYVYYDGLK